MNDFTHNAGQPRHPGTRAARMVALLTDALAPTRLDLRDESHLHAGHNRDAEHNAEHNGETHFRLTIASPKLDGLSRVAQQRLINTVLAPEFAAGLHALAIAVKA